MNSLYGFSIKILAGVAMLAIGLASTYALDANEWRQDLAELDKNLRSTHLNLFHTVLEAEHEGAVNALHERIPSMEDFEVALEMIRIVSMVRDGHTWLSYNETALVRKYPLSLYLFDDGLHVRYAMPPYERLVGSRLVRIGRAGAEEILRAAEPYVSRDNEWTVKARVVGLPMTPEFLKMKGFIDDMDSATAVFENVQEGRIEVALSPVSLESYRAWAGDLPTEKNAPMYRQDLDQTYWKKYLRKQKAVYVKFNAVVNKPGGPHLVGFGREVEAFYESKKAGMLIVDVRHNGGGNGDLLDPVVKRFARNPKINRKGRLFVLTSRHTFSAALMFIMRMELNTNVLFAGEPSGGKPNSYGEHNPFTLTHSKLTGSISTRFHQEDGSISTRELEEGETGDAREFLPMDIPVPTLAADYFAGRDPVLEAVFAYRP